MQTHIPVHELFVCYYYTLSQYCLIILYYFLIYSKCIQESGSLNISQQIEDKKLSHQ